jgi:hypothetical protein
MNLPTPVVDYSPITLQDSLQFGGEQIMERTFDRSEVPYTPLIVLSGIAAGSRVLVLAVEKGTDAGVLANEVVEGGSLVLDLGVPAPFAIRIRVRHDSPDGLAPFYAPFYLGTATAPVIVPLQGLSVVVAQTEVPEEPAVTIETDVSIDRQTGNIRYIGGGDNYTVLELHRYLQDLADDAMSDGAGELDITSATPSVRSTDNVVTLVNGYNIDQAMSQHLYAGSIIQAGGDEIWDGIVNYGSDGVFIDIVQNGALVSNFWTTGLNGNVDAGISHDFLLKVRDGGADIDGRRFIAQTRMWGRHYQEFVSNGTGRGLNSMSLNPVEDLNNRTADGETLRGVASNLTEGFEQLDVDDNSIVEPYYSYWTTGTGTINDLYEWTKFLTRQGTAESLYGLSGAVFRGITHSVPYNNLTGTLVEGAPVTFSNGATAQVLAHDGSSMVYVQLLTGVAPTVSDTFEDGNGMTATVNGALVSRAVNPTFLGQSLNLSVIGSYGVGIRPEDLSMADNLTSLDDVVRSPPNFVSFAVNGLVAGEDRVLVGPESGDDLETAQFTVQTALTGPAEAAVVVATPIPLDSPAEGTIRVQTDAGVYRRLAYASFSGSTFTLVGAADFSLDPVAVGNECFISYIDKVAEASQEKFTVVFDVSRPLFVRVRDGGGTPIQTFQSNGILGPGGGMVSVIRSADA